MLDNLTGSGLSESEVVAKMQAARSGEDQPSEPIESTDETDGEGEPEPIAEQEQEVADDAGEYESEEVEEDSDPSELYTVKVDGEEREVSLDDLLNNYSKGEDYTKKTMKIADERKAFEAESAQFVQQVEAEKQRFAQMTQQLQQVIGEQEKDQEYWAELRDTDPSEYLRQRDALDDKKKALEEAQKQQAEEYQKAMQQRRANEVKSLLDSVGSDWDSDKDRDADLVKMAAYTESMGMSKQEADQVLDHRFWLMVRDAMRYRELKNVGDVAKKQIKQAPKTVKSKRPVKRVNQLQTDARDRLRKSGGKDEASAVALLKSRRK